MSVAADPGQLRYSASRFAAGAQEWRNKAARAASLVQGAQAWKGQASQQFHRQAELLQQHMVKTGDALEQIADILQVLASRVEHVNERIPKRMLLSNPEDQ